MPKIRCKGCKTVLNVPDKALGKVISCPKCSTKMKVPTEAGAPQAAAPRKKAPAPVDTADVFAKLNLNTFGVEDESRPICPYCAATLEEDNPICRECGMNVSTGQMDAREKKRRSIRGPDPALFYKEVWRDSWSFLKDQKSLAFRTGLYWSLFSTLHAMCLYLGMVYCQRLPTQAFWLSLALLTLMGIPGWFLYLGTKVISGTILREKVQSDRIHFDFFLSISGGFRSIFWPLIVVGPLTPAAILLFYFMQLPSDGNAVRFGAPILWLLIPALVLPIAMVHMTARYTYKAWILWELVKLFAKNGGPSVYLLFVGLVVLLPVALVAGPIFWMMGTANPFVSDWVLGITDKITMKIMEIAELQGGPGTVWYALIKGPLNLAAASILFAPIAYVAAFPAVFIMRAIGVFGHYNLNTLDMVQRVLPGTPATFWVRYLSHTIDMLFLPFCPFLVTGNKNALMVIWFLLAVVGVSWMWVPAQLPYALGALIVYAHWMYWAVQESSQLKTTLGKDSFGLIVLTEKDKMVPLKTSSMKWFLRILLDATALGYLLAAFHPEKKAPHDLATKTKVVWKGDK